MNQSTHELKRPIQNIKTLVETLIMGAKDDENKLNEYLLKLNSEADRLGALVSDMLSLSHVINGAVDLHKVKVNFHYLVEKSFERAIERASKKNIKLINEIDQKFEIEADHKLLEHLLTNFIDNAIKYNHDNGSVFLRNTKTAFIVEDTGFGISDEDKAKVFEQFYRIKESAHIQGSGLGLSIVKGIADLHGWTIEIESELGKGTSFIINIL
jgi:two-component system phosphate regulon sensor histidine kinase PhoR